MTLQCGKAKTKARDDTSLQNQVW